MKFRTSMVKIGNDHYVRRETLGPKQMVVYTDYFLPPFVAGDDDASKSIPPLNARRIALAIATAIVIVWVLA